MNAARDGYMLLVFASAIAINATLFTNLNFNFKRDITPVASILRVPNVILVNPSFPVQTVPELIAYARANPGKINMATAGIGTTPHVFGELFKMMAGVNLLPVHYRGGGPALTDLLAGQVQLMNSIFATASYTSSRGRPAPSYASRSSHNCKRLSPRVRSISWPSS